MVERVSVESKERFDESRSRKGGSQLRLKRIRLKSWKGGDDHVDEKLDVRKTLEKKDVEIVVASAERPSNERFEV